MTFDFRFPSILAALVNACKTLHTLEVDLFHWKYSAEFTRHILEKECIEQFIPCIAASLGQEFSETVTKRPSTVQNWRFFGRFVKGKLLFDHKLVYTRKPKE